MKTETLVKNIIFEDMKIFDFISLGDLEKIKLEQINNDLIDIIVADLFNDSTISPQEFNKFLISTPEITKKLNDHFLNNEKEEHIGEILAKFQMTNIMNKQFLLFFNCNIEEFYSQLIVISNLNNLIEYIINESVTPSDTKTELAISITIINIHYDVNDDSQSDITFKCKKGKKINLEKIIKFLKAFFQFLIDTNDDKIIGTINSIFDDFKKKLKKIELRTKTENDINVLVCACLDEIINHVIFFDENINDINLNQIFSDNYCIRYRERKYNSALNFLKKNNTAIIKNKNLYSKLKPDSLKNSKEHEIYEKNSSITITKTKINLNNILDQIILKNNYESNNPIKSNSESQNQLNYKKINDKPLNRNNVNKSGINYNRSSSNIINNPSRFSYANEKYEPNLLLTQETNRTIFSSTQGARNSITNDILRDQFLKRSNKTNRYINKSPNYSKASNLNDMKNPIKLKPIFDNNKLEKGEKIFDQSSTTFSTSREVYNTIQTNQDYISEGLIDKSKRNLVLDKADEISNLNNSPMKISEKLMIEDLEVDSNFDLKSLALKQIENNKIKKKMKLEKFVREIEIKEEKSKQLINQDLQINKPCCNENDCIIF